jgi:hypothetical protein
MKLPSAGDKLICVNDKNLPSGAGPLVEGATYTVISARVNNYEQKIVFLVEVPNNGRTNTGLEWNGYDLKRFGLPKEEISLENSALACFS